jgi:hypothetical protein
MRGTTDNIVEAMVPVVATAETNAKTTQDAALSCSSLAIRISQIATTVNALRDMADELQTLVGKFKLGENTARDHEPRDTIATRAAVEAASRQSSTIELF